MNRFRVIATSILLTVIGVIIPLAASIYLSWIRAVNYEEKRLSEIAALANARGAETFNQAKETLLSLDKIKVKNPCSEEHIAMMRKVNISTLALEEVGYFENGKLKCSSWGLVQGKVPEFTPVMTTPKGIHISTNINVLGSQDFPLISFRYNAYNVVINPHRFIDIIVEPGIQVALATTKGQVIAELNNPDPLLVKKTLANPKGQLDANNLIAVSNKDGFIAISIEPREKIYQKFKDEQLYLLPFGLLIAAFIIGVVIYFSRRRLSLLGELAIAVDKHEFVVYYQPIIELSTGRCVGAEALVRWRRPNGEIVRPDLFIPQAEESGLILKITDQIIETVITELGKPFTVDRNLHVSINISANDVNTGRFLKVLENKMANTDIQLPQIWLEMTEGGFLELIAANETVNQARNLGFIVAIDDFGTGYSSLSYLQKLSLDILKIDKSFVDTIGTDSATSSVTPHIISMAKTLNLKMVAEGIETQQQLDYLLALNVEYGQGWLFSKAISVDEFIEFYQKTN